MVSSSTYDSCHTSASAQQTRKTGQQALTSCTDLSSYRPLAEAQASRCSAGCRTRVKWGHSCNHTAVSARPWQVTLHPWLGAHTPSVLCQEGRGEGRAHTSSSSIWLPPGTPLRAAQSPWPPSLPPARPAPTRCLSPASWPSAVANGRHQQESRGREKRCRGFRMCPPPHGCWPARSQHWGCSLSAPPLPSGRGSFSRKRVSAVPTLASRLSHQAPT